MEASGVPNVVGCRIPVPSGLNLSEWDRLLPKYHDQMLSYGWPIGYEGSLVTNSKFQIKNHRGALDYPNDIEKNLIREIHARVTMGPFDQSPFGEPIKVSPLNTCEKKQSTDRRVILDLSFPPEDSVNDHISNDFYMGEEIKLKFPTVDTLCDIVINKGRGCHLFKRDLKKAYKQIPICPGDYRKVGYMWKGQYYVDKVLSMGLRSAAHICQKKHTGSYLHFQ